MDINIPNILMQCIGITYQPWTYEMYNSFGNPIWLSNELAKVLFLYHVSKGISGFGFILCINWWRATPVRMSTHTHTHTHRGEMRFGLHFMEQSPSWEVNWFSASQEIPRILWNSKVHYRVYRWPPPVPIRSGLPVSKNPGKRRDLMVEKAN